MTGGGRLERPDIGIDAEGSRRRGEHLEREFAYNHGTFGPIDRQNREYVTTSVSGNRPPDAATVPRCYHGH